MTVTGWHLDGTPTTIEPRQVELERLYDRSSEEKKTASHKLSPHNPLRHSMERVLEVAMAAKNGDKFTKLWKGDWEDDYTSQSEADLALASMLGFYVGPNEELLDELFRQSGLYRDKWDRDDYRVSVLAKALDRDEFYSWGVSPAVEQLAKEVAAKGVGPQLAHNKKESPTRPND